MTLTVLVFDLIRTRCIALLINRLSDGSGCVFSCLIGTASGVYEATDYLECGWRLLLKPVGNFTLTQVFGHKGCCSVVIENPKIAFDLYSCCDFIGAILVFVSFLESSL